MKVLGIIIRRKSFGKRLAFSTLKVLSIEDSNEDNEGGSQTITHYLSSTDDSGGNGDNGDNENTKLDSNESGGRFDEKNYAKYGIETITINDEKIVALRLVFQRDSQNWNEKLDHTFPVKNSMLPYGAKIQAFVKRREPDEKSGCNHEVCSWEILDDPRVIALQQSKQNRVQQQNRESKTNENVGESNQNGSDEGGVLLHQYLKSRGLYYLKYNDGGKNVQNLGKHQQKKSSQTRNTTSSKTNQETNEADAIQTEEEKDTTRAAAISSPLTNNSHGDKKAKSKRAKIFAAWLLKEFGEDCLQQHGGVLDIAGGKGNLSIELSVIGANIQCTIIDPFIRRKSAHGKFLPNKEMKRIQKVHGKVPQHVAKYFLNNEESNRLVKASSCVVGLHPDQPTEDIVDLALQHNKPFAIIPCCVFPCLFPTRKLRSGKFVQSYEDFVEYLLQKDKRCQTTTLNFEGKNLVIYFKGGEKAKGDAQEDGKNSSFETSLDSCIIAS